MLEDKVGCQGFIVFVDNKNYSSGDTHKDIGYNKGIYQG